MADTGAPLSIEFMEVGSQGKEALFNTAMQTINDSLGGGGGGAFSLAGDISPAQLTSNQDNYNPAGLSTASTLRLSTDASRDLTGIASGTDGRILLLHNIGSFPLVLKDDVTSTAANRFQLNGDVTLAADEGALLRYDSTSARWRITAVYKTSATVPAASETTPGIAELATQAETDTGTDDLRIVTPLKLATTTTVVHPARTLSTTAPLAGGGDLSANRTLTIGDASDTAKGAVELATSAETSTGTDAGRAVTPDGLAGSIFGTQVIGILVTDPQGAALTTGDLKAYVRIPSTMNGMDLVAVAAHVSTVSSSGTPMIQLRNVTQAADMLTTRITIDVSENDSLTAAAPAVIDTSNDDVATGDEIAIDVDVAGTGAKGLFVELQFRLP